MPAVGSDGPWRDRVGLAQTMEQLSGMAFITGFADGPPVIPRGVCDGIAGLQACFASLLATWPAADGAGNGRGHRIECNMIESALGVAAEAVISHSAYGVLLERDGNRDPFRAPQNLYACRGREQWLALSVETDAQWRALCEWLGDPSWARDEAFAELAGRHADQDRIDEALAAHFSERDLEASVEALIGAGVPAAAVVPSPLVMRNPQHLARGFYETALHPVAGAQPYARLPMRFAAGPERHIASPAPLLGQHNDAVLGEELGLDADARAALREAGVVGERPQGY
jgi:crotonobetainyl-CoA:carnitine CoA-transferase CaiB-like acyl-CoA transferase